MKAKKLVVLLSSGLDSSVNLAYAVKNHEVLLVLTFDYGQKAAQKEIESAKKLAAYYSIRHEVIDLRWFKKFNQSSLLVESETIPQGGEVEIDSLEVSTQTAKSVWVPNRNGIFLNIAAGFAESLKADAIVPGFNIEEATTFPDNTEAFLQATTAAFRYSTSHQIEAICFTTDKNKTEIAKLGKELSLPFELIWPCYQSLQRWCGQCESCLRSKRAMLTAGVDFQSMAF